MDLGVQATDSGDVGSPREAELRCPLCEYDVRGLPEPRCPECGHRFDWAELTDPARMKLRWLFENRRGVRGYVGTQVRSPWPWRFWRSIRPAHVLAPWRLAWYAALPVVLIVALAAAMAVVSAAFLLQSNNLSMRSLGATPWVPGQGYFSAPAANGSTRPAGWTQADEGGRALRLTGAQFLDRAYPTWDNPRFWPMVWGHLRFGPIDAISVTGLAVSPLAAAIVVLGVMRQSFARARVRPAHAMRVAVYSADLAPLAGVAWLACAAHVAAELVNPRRTPWPMGLTWYPTDLTFIAMWAVGLLVVALCLARVEAGVRLYLGVGRAWTVATAWLVVAGLLAFLALLLPQERL